MLNAEQILNATDSTVESVDVPEWGGSVFVGTMTGMERDTWEAYATKQIDGNHANKNIRAMLCCLTMCDEQGNRLFKLSDLQKLGSKNGKAIDRVYSASIKLNKLTEEEIQELEKN